MTESSKKQEKIIIIAGLMPSTCCIYSQDGIPLIQLGKSHKNTIIYGGKGRYALVGGFGNLSGEYDIYDIIRLVKVGNGKASDATSLLWNYNQNIFIAATTFPRLRVDNG
jgi:translation initiation factor 2A